MCYLRVQGGGSHRLEGQKVFLGVRRGFPREGERAFQAQKWPAQRSEEGGQGRVKGQETLQLWKKLEMCAGLRGTGLWLPGKAFVLSKAQGESLKRDWVVVRAEVGGMG